MKEVIKVISIKLIALAAILAFIFAISCNSVVDSNSDPIWNDTDEMKPIIDKPDTSPPYHE